MNTTTSDCLYFRFVLTAVKSVSPCVRACVSDLWRQSSEGGPGHLALATVVTTLTPPAAAGPSVGSFTTQCPLTGDHQHLLWVISRHRCWCWWSQGWVLLPSPPTCSSPSGGGLSLMLSHGSLNIVTCVPAPVSGNCIQCLDQLLDYCCVCVCVYPVSRDKIDSQDMIQNMFGKWKQKQF